MDRGQLPEWHDPLFDDDKKQPDPNDGKLALASVICGVISLLMVCVSGISALLGAAAIVCGVISRKRCENAGMLPTIGIILGVVTIGIALVLLGSYGMRYLLGGLAGSITSADPNLINEIEN